MLALPSFLMGSHSLDDWKSHDHFESNKIYQSWRMDGEIPNESEKKEEMIFQV